MPRISRLRIRFPIPVTLLPVLALDPTAYDDRRQQADADSLIAIIQRRYAALLHEPEIRIIGVTAHEMYTPTENWLFAFFLPAGEGNRVAAAVAPTQSRQRVGTAPARKRIAACRNASQIGWGASGRDESCG
jgi:hypothetical protein